MHPLDGPRRKLDRAAIHIKTLNEVVRVWCSSNPFSIIAEDFNADKTAYIYRFEAKAVPIDIGIIAGDAIHNMRSALDYIAWQLMLLSPLDSRPRRWKTGVQFPIFLKIDNKKDEENFNRSMQYFPIDAIKIIKSLQPYNTPKPYKSDRHPLWRLNQLSNADKHHTVPIRGAGLAIDYKAGMIEQGINEYTLEVTVPMLSKKLILPPPQVKYHVSFGDRNIGYDIQVEDFSKMHKYIANVVLPSFERFFPNRS